VVKLGAVAGTEQLASLVKRAAGPLDAWLDRVVRAGRGDATRTAAGSPVNRRIRIALPSRDSSASTMVDPPARTGTSSHCGLHRRPPIRTRRHTVGSASWAISRRRRPVYGART
jgi:hypothetical protein